VILVDTSIWIDHLHRGDDALAALLARDEVLTHPFIIGELALGSLRRRDFVLRALYRLPGANVARHDEVMQMITREKLSGLGIGYIDVHLIAATRITPDALLWTRDRRLAAAAGQLSLSAPVVH